MTCTATITEIKSIGNNEKMVIETDVKTTEGELVCKSYNTIVERGPDDRQRQLRRRRGRH